MKQTYFVLAFFCMLMFSKAQAQEDSLWVDSMPSVSYRHMLDSCFRNVNLDSVPTGLLIEKAISTVDVSLYAGTINDSNKADMSILKRAFGTLRRASVDTSIANDTGAISALADTIDFYYYNGYMPIAILNYQYSCIKENAFEDSLLRMEGVQLFDVEGREQNPYENHYCFVAASAADYVDSLTVRYIFPQSLYVTNDTREVDYLEVDFGDGNGYVTVTFNTAIVIVYDSAYDTEISIRLHFTNTETSASVIPIKLQDRVFYLGDVPGKYDAKLFFESENEYLEGTGAAVVFVHYSCNNTERIIKRPFIVTTGFVDPKQAYHTIKTDNFWNGADYYISINDRDQFDLGIINKIQEQEYDLIFVNFYKPTDYIQRNAYVMEDIIKWVNAQKAINGSKAKNVVLGTSMGGLVCAYALAHMHKLHTDNSSNPAHDTRVFFSHDGPLNGLNAPLGFQAMVKNMNRYYFDMLKISKKELPDIDWDYQTLACSSAQQMFINNIFQNDLRAEMLAEMASFGNLNNIGCKVVGISNGSGTGVPQGNGMYGTGYWLPLLPGFGIANYYETSYNSWGKARYTANFNLMATPIPSTIHKKVFDGMITNRMNGEMLYYYSSYAKAASNQLIGLDGVPGSVGKPGALIGKELMKIFKQNFTTPFDYECFIPSVSAVNLDNSILSLTYNNFYYSVNNNRSDCITNRFISQDDQAVPSQVPDERNTKHAEFNSYSVGVFLPEMLNIAPETLANYKQFNYGHPLSDRIGSVLVEEYAKLGINTSDEVGLDGDNYNNNSPSTNSTHIVETRLFTSCLTPAPATIIIEGELQLGDNTGNLSGEFVIRDGSKLILKNGSNVKLYNNSKLIIEEGAELEIEDGITTLLLDGDNSEIIIKGEFTTHNDVDFTFTGSGNMVFNCPTGVACSTNFGTNNTISFTGDNRSDKVLVVTGKGLDLTGVNSFSVTAGKIELGGNTEIKLDGSLTLNSAKVSKLSTAAGSYIHNGLLINSLSGKTISIQHSKFEYAKHGLTKSATSTISPLVISETSFESCEIGLKTTQGACTLTKIRFDDCLRGWKAISMTANSSFNGFSDNTILPIEYAGNSSANLSVNEAVFQNCTDVEYGLGTAIYATGEFDLTIACSHFLTNDRDVDVSDADLILTGGNYFHNTLINTLQLNNAATLGLAGGSNNFIYDVNPEDYVIKGTLSSGITSLMINGNYWEMFDGSNNPVTDLYSGLLDLKNSSNNAISCTTATRLTTSDICLDKWSGVQEVVEKTVRHPNKGIDKSDLRVLYTFYPNPASNSILLKAFNGASKENLTVKAIDVMGKSIVLQGLSVYDISQLSVGMYQIIVEQNGHILHKQKLVVSK